MTDSAWGKPGFAQDGYTSRNTLTGVLSDMKIGTRQAIYALAVKARFRRGTWDGCVMNQVADGARNTFAAADYFGESESTISRFIRIWDLTSQNIADDGEATHVLVRALQHVGFVPASPVVKDTSAIYRVRLHTSEETQQVEELRQEIENGAFDSLLDTAEEFCLV